MQARTKKYAETRASASEAGKLAVSNLIIQGKAKEAKEETKYWIDKRMVQRVINEQQPIHSKDENSFDAVSIMKRALNEVDEYYVYRINNGSLNGESDYVFKSSDQMAQLAICMDVNGPEDGLQMENAYFDVTHTRVHSFKSFALWLVHGPMREMIRLASMEMQTKNSNDIAIFFQLFNEILEKVSGIRNYKFDPQCFLCDEGGVNYKAVKIIYGEDFCCDRVRGCQFHFKQQVQKRNMKFLRTTKMSLLKYVMNCVLLQLLLDRKYSKAGLKRWHVQHRHYGCGSISGMFEDCIYLGHLGIVDYLDATCQNRVTKVGNQLALCI